MDEDVEVKILWQDDEFSLIFVDGRLCVTAECLVEPRYHPGPVVALPESRAEAEHYIEGAKTGRFVAKPVFKEEEDLADWPGLYERLKEGA